MQLADVRIRSSGTPKTPPQFWTFPSPKSNCKATKDLTVSAAKSFSYNELTEAAAITSIAIYFSIAFNSLKQFQADFIWVKRISWFYVKISSNSNFLSVYIKCIISVLRQTFPQPEFYYLRSFIVRVRQLIYLCRSSCRLQVGCCDNRIYHPCGCVAAPTLNPSDNVFFSLELPQTLMQKKYLQLRSNSQLFFLLRFESKQTR